MLLPSSLDQMHRVLKAFRLALNLSHSNLISSLSTCVSEQWYFSGRRQQSLIQTAVQPFASDTPGHRRLENPSNMGLFRRKTTIKRPASEVYNPSILSRASSTRLNGAKDFSVYSQRSPKLIDVGYQSPRNKMIPKIALPEAPDPAKDPAAYLRSIYAVRERTKLVLEKAKRNELKHFDVDLDKFQDTAGYVVAIIKRDFEGNYGSIPPHGRWQHFEVGGRPRVTQLLQSWPSSVDAQERTRRLIDLFLVSVLLDAGAGTKWSYKSKENGQVYKRSEGLAVASLEMFKTGIFSSDENQPYQVDARGLSKMTVESLAKGMQVSQDNPMSGLEGRAGLLMRLSQALKNQNIFGETGRPGNMIGEYHFGPFLPLLLT